MSCNDGTIVHFKRAANFLPGYGIFLIKNEIATDRPSKLFLEERKWANNYSYKAHVIEI